VKRVLKFTFGAFGIVFLAIAGVAVWMSQGMERITDIQPDIQIDTRVYDRGFQSAIDVSRERLRQARIDLAAPALSLAVGVQGEVVWAEALGVTDLKTAEPVTVDSRFAIGSVSKTLTATLAARLAEQGRLDLDVDARTYVPSFPEKDFPFTTRQLLSHQAGIRHYEFKLNPPVFSESAITQQFDSVTDSLSLFAEDDLLFEPDTSFNYSTYGYTLVSAVIEGASDERFLEHLRDTLLTPLGMTQTSADYADREIENRVSDYVQLYPGADLLPAPEVNVSSKWAGGGLASTPSDLVRFGNALLAGDIVSQKTLGEMLTPRELRSGELNPQHYGLGWRVGGLYYPNDSDTIVTFINHGGTAIGGVAILIFMPESELVVAMCANSSGRNGSGALTKEAAAIVRTFLDTIADKESR